MPPNAQPHMNTHTPWKQIDISQYNCILTKYNTYASIYQLGEVL